MNGPQSDLSKANKAFNPTTTPERKSVKSTPKIEGMKIELAGDPYL
jgi:hypothetical protein